ncbi:neck protein [Vibrio phage 1.052.A._10N.286.46.C3]|nr:neck protein [Vibrio phage 1.052.A._10N.286.46.C3]
MTPENTLKAMQKQLKSMTDFKSKSVAVGVLANKSTGKIYESGATVIEVAAAHEYGTVTTPERSFLRMPQEFKQKELSAFINKKMISVLGGDATTVKGLGLIGVYAVNLSQDAFDSSGFGKWPDIDAKTKNRKGSSAILINRGVLRQSISWEIR